MASLVCTHGRKGDAYWEFELPVNPESATNAKKFYVPISQTEPWPVKVTVTVTFREYMWNTTSRDVKCGGYEKTDDDGNTYTWYHEYTVEDLNEWYEDRSFDAEKIKTVDIKGHMYEDDFTGDS